MGESREAVAGMTEGLGPAWKYSCEQPSLCLGAESGCEEWEKMGCGVRGEVIAGGRESGGGVGKVEELRRKKKNHTLYFFSHGFLKKIHVFLFDICSIGHFFATSLFLFLFDISSTKHLIT